MRLAAVRPGRSRAGSGLPELESAPPPTGQVAVLDAQTDDFRRPCRRVVHAAEECDQAPPARALRTHGIEQGESLAGIRH